MLALSDSLGASHWAMNAKALTLKSFISDRFLLGTLFSCHWSFPINRFHLAHLDCLCNHHHLPYMYFLTLHTNTRAQNPQIHSSEYTLAIPTERSPSRMQKAGWRSRFCMMNCVGALFVLTFSLLLVCYLSKLAVCLLNDEIMDINITPSRNFPWASLYYTIDDLYKLVWREGFHLQKLSLHVISCNLMKMSI